MNDQLLLRKFKALFSDAALFPSEYVNEKEYLSAYKLHARVCGLLVRAGIELNYIVDVGRKFPIDPLGGPNQRKQHQAEADVSFIDLKSKSPIALLDYETSDAHIDKMRGKFDYLSTFAKHTSTLQLLGLFITVTGVMHGWDKGEKESDRHNFAKKVAPSSIVKLLRSDYNSNITFLLGTFYTDHLNVSIFKSGTDKFGKEIIFYGASNAA